MTEFKTLQQIIDKATQQNVNISDIVIQSTANELNMTTEEIYGDMRKKYEIMKQSIQQGIDKDLKSNSGLTGGMAYKMHQSVLQGNFSGSFLGEVITSALAVSEINACMGCIVAAPTAGSCGIIPACLITLQKHMNIDEHTTIMGLINTSAIGYIIARNASISGAEGGCQAECGSASAMIASAMVEMLGGTPAQCGDAAAQALKSLMGLVCDPVAGLVEEPCVIRNASSATVAVTCAEITLAGIPSIIPVDEVILAMGRVGDQLHVSLKETAKGGIAITKTALELQQKIFGY